MKSVQKKLSTFRPELAERVNSHLSSQKAFIQHRSSGAGFTLIELLVVIAILGILAAVLLVGVNPLEQLARGRDTSRKSVVAQLGHAMESYVTNTASGTGGNLTYPAWTSAWQTSLTTNKETKSIASITQPTGACTTNVQSGICYQTLSSGNDSVIWTMLESQAEKTKSGCTSGGTTFHAAAWIAGQGKAGTVCLNSATALPTANASIY